MDIHTRIAVTLVVLLLASGTLDAKSTKFRQDGPKKTTIITLKQDWNSVTGTFLFGDRVRDPDAEPRGRAIPFTGKVKSRSSNGEVSMEIYFAGKAPLDRKKNRLNIWQVKKTADGHRYLTMPLAPQKLDGWISSQGASRSE